VPPQRVVLAAHLADNGAKLAKLPRCRVRERREQLHARCRRPVFVQHRMGAQPVLDPLQLRQRARIGAERLPAGPGEISLPQSHALQQRLFHGSDLGG
jgi:hypothetical protein